MSRRRIRRGDRLEIRKRRERGELAHGQSAHELFRIAVREDRYRLQGTRHHGGFQVLQTPRARDDRAGQDKVQGLRLPDRDEVHRLQDGLQDKRGARYLRKPPRGSVKDERRHLRRGVLRGDASALGRLDKALSENQGTITHDAAAYIRNKNP